ncbi:MAG: DUF177 domain-containing protein [Propionibacteriaceae bacterium]|jgi:uncharacterized protein|nr:DUF177 domain-containing protein [Propionibacteriaceae bacterium]
MTPTKDFVLTLHDLRRTPGASRPIDLDATFGEQVVSGLITIPAERPVQVAGLVESVGDGVLVSVDIATVVDAQCSRCLTQFTIPVEVQAKELFVYPEQVADYADEDVSQIHDEAADLAQVIRDAVVIDLPLIPLCRPDCRGLCPDCGQDLNAAPDHQPHATIDSRWLGLAQWGKMS